MQQPFEVDEDSNSAADQTSNQDEVTLSSGSAEGDKVTVLQQ